MTINKNIAIYELLHAHARGETDLSEDQLANVVTETCADARTVGARALVARGRGYGGH